VKPWLVAIKHAASSKTITLTASYADEIHKNASLSQQSSKATGLGAARQKKYLPIDLDHLIKGTAAMSHMTLNLDDATQALVDQAAQAHGVSKSQWVADIIRQYSAQESPQDCLALAGRFADFPLCEEGPVDAAMK
jgi:hypothetical protein